MNAAARTRPSCSSVADADSSTQELFIQYLAEQGHSMAKLDRKPRRNIQYKDLCRSPRHLKHCPRANNQPPPASAVTHKDNLEFLDDTIPKTIPYREVKQKAAETRAKLTGAKTATAATGEQPEELTQTNGKRQKTFSNGFGVSDVMKRPVIEGRTADAGDGDVHMTG